jgi:hypothetical protein
MLLKACISLVVGLLVVVGAACLGTRPPPTPEPTVLLQEARSTAGTDDDNGFTADALAASAVPSVHHRIRVAGAGGEGVNLRREPGMAGSRLKGLFDGAELEVIGADRQAEGRTWRNVRDPSDRTEGWVAADFLAPAAER